MVPAKSNPKTPTDNGNIWRTIGIILIGMIIGYVIGRFELSSIQNDDKKINAEDKTQVEQQDKGNDSNKQAEEPTIVDVSVDDDAYLGDEDAPIIIVEFSDYQCPFCKKLYTNILPSIKTDFIDTGKVKYVFRDFPLNIHPAAINAAMATECANDQSKFWEMHDYIFSNQTEWSATKDVESLNEILIGYAATLGLNSAEFSECLTSGKYKDEVNEDKQEGASYGVQSTPTLFINGMRLRGVPQDYNQLKKYLDEQLDS